MRIIPLVPLLLLASAHTGFGLGFRLTDKDAEATARGNAFTATADNPSAVYYNPAGITQLDGLNVRTGYYGIVYDEQVHSGGQRFDTRYNPQAVPNSYMTWKPKPDSPVAFGLGIFVPYGLNLKYNDTVPFRKLGVEGSLLFISATPIIAWQITNTLSVAAGPSLNYADVTLQQGIVKPGDRFRFSGTDVSAGGEFGICWAPTPMHSFGFSYHSATGMDFRGLSQTKFDDVVVPVQVAPGVVVPFRAAKGMNKTQQADARFHFPQYMMLGYSFRPTPDWNFEVDIDYTDWDSLNTVTLRQKSGNAAIPFNYRSSFMYDFGVTRTFGTWHASAGYMYSQNSVKNEDFNPLVPDSNRHVLSVGVGRKVAQWSWDIAYQFAYGPSRTISQGSLADGRYRFNSNAISISIGHTF